MIAGRMLAAGILLLGPIPALSQGPSAEAGWAGAEVVSVTLSSFRFDPSTIDLKQGHVYDLRLTNVSSGDHNFAAKDFFAAAKVLAADQTKIVDGKVSLRSGQSLDIHVVAPHPGTYEVRCTHFMHSAFGMTGEIVVQ